MTETAIDENASEPSRDLFPSFVRWALACTAIIASVIVLALLNNNYSVRRISRGEFRARMDRSIEMSTNWLSSRTDVFGNPALMFMIVDMEKMSGDRRLRQMLSQYAQSKYITGPGQSLRFVWARMLDSLAPVPLIDATQVPAGDVVEVLWDAYAIAPDRVMISPAQRENLFSRSKYIWGRRHHQLLAIDIYRYYHGGSPKIDSTLNHLAEKVARDAHYDLRVNDSYPQRSAFVLAAGRPDLVRSRWIERLLSYQHPDGSWSSCWYRWCKGVLEFSAQDQDPTHTTVQAAWLLYMLKYRFPQWLNQHYQ